MKFAYVNKDEVLGLTLYNEEANHGTSSYTKNGKKEVSILV